MEYKFLSKEISLEFLVLEKKIIKNQLKSCCLNLVSRNVFDLQNEFHENDEIGTFGKTNILGHFCP
jgi:hypothetical protein